MGSRARSAHSARVIDESGDHKNHSPDPDAAAAAAAVTAAAATTAARGEAGSAALVCEEFAAEHTFRERAFPPGAPLPPPRCRYSADPDRRPPFPKIRRRRNVLRSSARCIFRRGPQRIPAPQQKNARTRTSSHAYRSADLLFSAPPLLFLLSSLTYNRSRLVNTWRRR